jgi:hypothetical protein
LLRLRADKGISNRYAVATRGTAPFAQEDPMSLSEGNLKHPHEAISFDKDPFAGIEDGRALAQAIVDTIREPLLVLNKYLRAVVASRGLCPCRTKLEAHDFRQRDWGSRTAAWKRQMPG